VDEHSQAPFAARICFQFDLERLVLLYDPLSGPPTSIKEFRLPHIDTLPEPIVARLSQLGHLGPMFR